MCELKQVVTLETWSNAFTRAVFTSCALSPDCIKLTHIIVARQTPRLYYWNRSLSQWLWNLWRDSRSQQNKQKHFEIRRQFLFFSLFFFVFFVMVCFVESYFILYSVLVCDMMEGQRSCLVFNLTCLVGVMCASRICGNHQEKEKGKRFCSAKSF